MFKARTGPKTKPRALRKQALLLLSGHWTSMTIVPEKNRTLKADDSKTTKQQRGGPEKHPRLFCWDLPNEGKPELAHPSKGTEASSESTLALSG